MLACKEIRENEIVFWLSVSKSIIIPKDYSHSDKAVINRLVYDLVEQLENEEVELKEFNNG